MHPLDGIHLDLAPWQPAPAAAHAADAPNDAAAASTVLVDAATDSAIARAFLDHADLAAPTRKSMKTELGRFLLWCRAEQRTLAMLKIEDLTRYREWLRDPQPAEQWVCTIRWPRNDPRWRPFSGPLSDASARQAFRVVKALLAFATNAGYLQRNPGSLVKNIKTPSAARVTRYLSEQAIHFVFAVLDSLPAHTPVAVKVALRDRFLFLCFITTGARLSEISAAAMGALYTEGDGRWWLDVVGKGSKPRRLPVSPDLLAAYRAYRAAFQLAPIAARDDAMPLVLKTRGSAYVGVTDEAVGNALKAVFAAAASLAQAQGDVDAASSLRQASAHWLRHTMLTVQANNDVALKTLQQTAGHANLSTTAMYLHKSDKDRHDEIVQSLQHTTPNRQLPDC